MQRFEELSSSDYQKRAETNEIYIAPGPRLGDTVIEANGISKSFGDLLAANENVSFSLPKGGIVGIIGPNGVGKDALFRMITGQEQLDAGIQSRRNRQNCLLPIA